MSRRSFLAWIGAAAAGAVGLLALARAKASGGWIPIGRATAFKRGKFTKVMLPARYGGGEIYVTQRSDSSFLAISARCTHRGCMVNWNARDSQFVCPCHGGRFDATGRNVSGPPPSPLKTLATQVDQKGILDVQVPS